MTSSRKDNITILKQESTSINELVQEITKSFAKFSSDNIIVKLNSQKEIKSSDVLKFLQISNKHLKSKHSFVIVTDSIQLDEIPEEIVVVPTLQEAFDIIEMEEIERDLGF